MKKKFILSITLLFGVGLIWAQEPAICVHEDDKEFTPFESDLEVKRIAESFSWNLENLPKFDQLEENLAYEPFRLSDLISLNIHQEKTDVYNGSSVKSGYLGKETIRGECSIAANSFPCELRVVKTISEFRFSEGSVFELAKNHFLFLGPNDSLLGGFVETIWNDPSVRFYNYYIFPLENDVFEQTPIINVFPNPTTGIINIKITNLSTGEYTIDLIGQAGEVVMLIDNGTSARKIYERTVNLTDLPSTIYYLRLKTPEKTYTQKLILN